MGPDPAGSVFGIRTRIHQDPNLEQGPGSSRIRIWNTDPNESGSDALSYTPETQL
jgi:hypothetical protein